MTKSKKQYVPPADFQELTPEMLIGAESPDPLYEKAFLAGDEKCRTEYAENTTTWD